MQQTRHAPVRNRKVQAIAIAQVQRKLDDRDARRDWQLLRSRGDRGVGKLVERVPVVGREATEAARVAAAEERARQEATAAKKRQEEDKKRQEEPVLGEKTWISG